LSEVAEECQNIITPREKDIEADTDLIYIHIKTKIKEIRD
jgi:hypothetical protein